MRLPKRQRVRELIVPSGGTVLRCGRNRQTGFPYHWHDHPEIELTLITAGRGRRHVGDSVERFATGDLVLIGPGTPHTWHTEPAPGVSVGSIVVQFAAEPLIAAARALPELAGIRQLLSDARRGLVARGVLRDRIEAEMLALADETSPLARLSRLLAALARFGDGSACRPLASVAYQPPERTADAAAERVARFIQDHRHEPLPQSRLAALAGVSTAAFSRWFKTRFRRGYRAYLMELRVAGACRLLADSDRTVMDIALASGFQNLANFNRRFRQVRSATPTEYRTAARGG